MDAALIGADGIRSTIRQQMRNEGPPRTIGYVAHRTIVPMSDINFDVDRDDVVLWSGDGFHIVHYPLRNHTLFNVVTVFKTLNVEPTDTESPHPDLRACLSRLASDHEESLGDDGSVAARLGVVRPRSDPALEQGPRHVAG